MDKNLKKSKEVEELKKEKVKYDNIFRTLKEKFFDDVIDKKTINIKPKGVIEESDDNKKFRSVKFEKSGEEKEQLKSFENEDKISFKGSNSLARNEDLDFNYKLLSYAEKFYDEFLNIKRKCENERKTEKIKPYVDRVQKMRKIMLKKINSSQCTTKDKNLVLYMEEWLGSKNRFIRLRKRRNQPTYTGKNINDKRSVSDLDSIYTPGYNPWYKLNEENFHCVKDDLKKSEPTFKNGIENNEKLYEPIINNVIPELQKFDYSDLFNSLKEALDRDVEKYLKSVVELEKDLEKELKKRYGGSEQLENDGNDDIEDLYGDFDVDGDDLYKRFYGDGEDDRDSEIFAESGENDESEKNDNSKFTLSCYSDDTLTTIKKQKDEIKLINGEIQNMKIERSNIKSKSIENLFKTCFEFIYDLFSPNSYFSNYKLYLKHLKSYAVYRLNRFYVFISEILGCMDRYNILCNSYYMLKSATFCEDAIMLYKKKPEESEEALCWLKRNSSQIDFLFELVDGNTSYGWKNKDKFVKSPLGKGLKECIKKTDTSLKDQIEIYQDMLHYNLSFDAIKSMLFKNNFIQKNVKNNLRKIFVLIPHGLFEQVEKIFSVKANSITSSYKEKEEEIKFKDLGFKLRNVIESWTFGLNKILKTDSGLKEPKNLYYLNKLRLLKEFLNIVDDYILCRQNEFEDHRHFELGFNDGKLKGKTLESKLEKKMWNVSNRKKLKKPEKDEYIGDGKNKILFNRALSNCEPYFDVRDIKQGNIGDCWLEATLKSMSLKSPDKLLEIFPNYLKEVSSDGSLLGNYITVRLYDYYDTKDGYKPLEKNGKKQYYDISVNITELTVYGQSVWNRGRVLWPHMIERAVDKFMEEFHHRGDKNYGEQIQDENGAKASVILTGESSVINKVNNKNFKDEKDENKKKKILEDILKNLKDSLDKYNSPTCGTSDFKGDVVNGKVEEMKKLEALGDDEKRSRYIYSHHAYAIKKVIEDKSNISRTKIYLINPWGVETENDIIGGNEVTITLEEFATYFNYFDSIYKKQKKSAQ